MKVSFGNYNCSNNLKAIHATAIPAGLKPTDNGNNDRFPRSNEAIILG